MIHTGLAGDERARERCDTDVAKGVVTEEEGLEVNVVS